jgi:hypothetical protein
MNYNKLPAHLVVINLEPWLQARQVEQPVSVDLVAASDLQVVAHQAMALHQVAPQVADATILDLAAAAAAAAAAAMAASVTADPHSIAVCAGVAMNSMHRHKCRAKGPASHHALNRCSAISCRASHAQHCRQRT